MQCQHHDLRRVDPEIDGVREMCQHCAARFTVDPHERHRALGDPLHETLNRRDKPVTESRTAGLVPSSCFHDFVYGFRPKDNDVSHS